MTLVLYYEFIIKLFSFHAFIGIEKFGTPFSISNEMEWDLIRAIKQPAVFSEVYFLWNRPSDEYIDLPFSQIFS